MKIGYVNYNLGLQIEMSGGRSQGDVGHFLGVLKMLTYNGNVVVLYTPFDKKSYESYLNIKNSPDHELYSVLKNVEYKPDQRYVDDDTELLYVNGGPTNLMYGDSAWGVSSIVKCMLLLKSYNGLVFLAPGEVELEIPLFLEGFNPKLFLLDNNVSTYDILKNKRYVILTKAYKVENFYKFCSTPRNIYKELGIEVEYFNDSSIVSLNTKYTIASPNELCNLDLIYVGNRRLRVGSSRYNRVIDLMDGRPNSAVYGDWEDKDFIHTKPSGKIPYGDTFEIMNKSIATLIITDDEYHKDNLSLVTNRLFDTILAGGIPIVHNQIDLSPLDIKIPDELIFNTREELDRCITYLKSLNYYERRIISKTLFSQISKFQDVGYYANNLQQAYDRYKNDIGHISEAVQSRFEKNVFENFMDPKHIVDYGTLLRHLCIIEISILVGLKYHPISLVINEEYKVINNIRACKKCGRLITNTRSSVCGICYGSGETPDIPTYVFNKPLSYYIDKINLGLSIEIAGEVITNIKSIKS